VCKTRVYIRLILIVVYVIVFFFPPTCMACVFLKFCDEVNCTVHCKHCRVKLSPDVNRRSLIRAATYNITKIFDHIFVSYVGMRCAKFLSFVTDEYT
jgi:hypothetical protein